MRLTTTQVLKFEGNENETPNEQRIRPHEADDFSSVARIDPKQRRDGTRFFKVFNSSAVLVQGALQYAMKTKKCKNQYYQLNFSTASTLGI